MHSQCMYRLSRTTQCLGSEMREGMGDPGSMEVVFLLLSLRSRDVSELGYVEYQENRK